MSTTEEKQFHQSGESVPWDAWSDEHATEKELGTRAANLKHRRDAQRRNAEEHRRQATQFDAEAEKYDSQLQTVLRIAEGRGFKLNGEGGE